MAPDPLRRWAEEDDFLPAVLGILSMGRRMDRALSALPPPVQPAGPSRPEVLAVLGLVSLWRRIDRVILPFCTLPDPAPGPKTATPPRELQR